MTDETTAPEPIEPAERDNLEADDNTDAPDTDAPDAGDTTADGQLAKARKDAAKYRERLRDTETTRDTLTGTVETLRRQLIDQQATGAGLKPAALWATVTVDALLNDAGAIDAEKVTAAISAAREQLGIGRFPGTADQGARIDKAPAVATWNGLLKTS